MIRFKKNLKNYWIHCYLVVYTFTNLFTLTAFPFIHSDEAWIAGLTNDYIRHRTVFVTESFFDLMPRTVHTMKSLYHLVQVPFVTLFGHTPFSVRLISLIAAVMTLYFFHQLMLALKIHTVRSQLYTILFSLNVQFVYAAHFGRQEMMLLMTLTIGLYLYYSNRSVYKAAVLLGFSIGFHPNAFIISAIIGVVLLKDCLIKKSLPFRQLIGFVGIIGGFAAIHIGITLLVNQSFISEYWAYGQTFGVDAVPSGRMTNFRDFYLKLYYQVSGTYYIPPMQLLYVIGGFLSMATLIFSLSKKWYSDNPVTQLMMDASLMVIGFNLAVFLIGRFNTTSITFLILPLYILFSMVFESICQYKQNNRHSTYIFCGMLTAAAVISIQTLSTEYRLTSNHTYDDYLAELHQNIDDDAVILGNLSGGFLFHDHKFYDIRNLAYIGKSTDHSDDSSVEAYITNRGIDTILYYEEYDYIHRNQQWEILYGDDEAWYGDLQHFLDEQATLEHEFDNMYYGSRIIRFLGDYPWKVSVYKVK